MPYFYAILLIYYSYFKQHMTIEHEETVECGFENNNYKKTENNEIRAG